MLSACLGFASSHGRQFAAMRLCYPFLLVSRIVRAATVIARQHRPCIYILRYSTVMTLRSQVFSKKRRSTLQPLPISHVLRTCRASVCHSTASTTQLPVNEQRGHVCSSLASHSLQRLHRTSDNGHSALRPRCPFLSSFVRLADSHPNPACNPARTDVMLPDVHFHCVSCRLLAVLIRSSLVCTFRLSHCDVWRGRFSVRLPGPSNAVVATDLVSNASVACFTVPCCLHTLSLQCRDNCQ